MHTPIRNSKSEITNLLRITELTYANIVEQFGYDFARHFTMHNEWSVKYLTRTAAYWNWWKKQWLLRDEIFLIEYGSYIGAGIEDELLMLWIEHHLPKQIESYPASYILAEAWRLMIEEVNTEREGILNCE